MLTRTQTHKEINPAGTNGTACVEVTRTCQGQPTRLSAPT